MVTAWAKCHLLAWDEGKLDGRRKTKFMEPLVFFWQLIHCCLPLPAGQEGSMAWMGGKERPTKVQEWGGGAHSPGCLAIRSWIVSSPQGMLEVLIINTSECDPTWRERGSLQKCSVASVMSDSLQPHGMQSTRLLCPWDSPGKHTGVGWHFLWQPSYRDSQLKMRSAGWTLIQCDL